MTSLKISFETGGARLVLDESVEGFDAVAQNGVVNLATQKGSDSSDEDRGTDLLTHALQGKVADLLAAQHIANLAAIDTLFYLRNSDELETTEERVSTIVLQPFEYDGKELHLSAIFTGNKGSVNGIDTTI